MADDRIGSSIRNENVEEIFSAFIFLLDRELKSKYLFLIKLYGEDLNNRYRDIMLKLINLYLTNDIHTIFLPTSIEKVSKYIHSDSELREFATEVIDKLNVLLSSQTLQMFCEKLCKNLSYFHNGEDEEYAGPRQYIQGLYFNPDTMYADAIMRNHWLLFTILLLLTFDRSEHFTNFDKL